MARFTHHRLDAYNVAVQLTVAVEALAASLPRGHANLRDQLRRAASSVACNIAEGANRRTPRDKRARFVIAVGEAGECDAALELVGALGLADRTEVQRLQYLAERVGAMLSGLIRRQA